MKLIDKCPKALLKNCSVQEFELYNPTYYTIPWAIEVRYDGTMWMHRRFVDKMNIKKCGTAELPYRLFLVDKSKLAAVIEISKIPDDNKFERSNNIDEKNSIRVYLTEENLTT